MEAKKDRGRFTLRLNEHDPAHAEVIRLLEQQGPHSKGRFIVNAILHYVHGNEKPGMSIPQSPDREAIKKIIYEIMSQEMDVKILESVSIPQKQNESKENKKSLLKQEDRRKTESNVDENTKTLIQSALFAFRSNK